MKIPEHIDFNKLSEEGFRVIPHMIAGDLCYLVVGEISTKWTKDNLIFRSSLWTSDGKPVSFSFRKFFNYTEKPEIIPDPVDLKDATLIEKLDGSALIVSKYKGELIIRTRGTVDATKLDFGDEIEILKQKYPKAFDNFYINNETVTLIFEWLSAKQKIVLSYPDCPDMRLVGAIHHDNYEYYRQADVDLIAEFIDVKRPERYTFDTMENMINTIKNLDGKEGICIYYNDEQDIKKLKSLSYLKLHAFKSELGIESMIDLYLQWDKPSYSDFMNRIETTFDWECAQMARPVVSQICDAKKVVDSIIKGMENFVSSIKGLTRKEQAAKVLASYGKESNRSGFVFKILDGKQLDKEAYKKLLFQVLK